MIAIHNTEWRLRRAHLAPVVWDNSREGWLEEARHSGRFFIPRHPRLGAHLAKPEFRLKLADYYDRATAAPPPAVSRPHPGVTWGMLGNDSVGDCVIAMMLHTVMEWYLDQGLTPPLVTTEDALRIYSAVTGYDPAEPDTDRGTDEGQAMDHWKDPGLELSDGSTHRIVDALEINPQDQLEVKIGISEFGAVQFGTDLPLTAQGQSEWDLVGDPNNDENSRPGSWGGHGIPGREYDTDHVKVITWGAELLETWAFHGAYCVQAFVPLSEEIADKQGVGPSGVQWDDLVSDFHKLSPQDGGKDSEQSEPKRPRSRRAKAQESDESPAESREPVQDPPPDADQAAVPAEANETESGEGAGPEDKEDDAS